MGWKDLFKKDKDTGPDPVTGLTLGKMKAGYVVDYDLKSWEVTAYNSYDWGDGDLSHEWQLKNSDQVLYLELESDDEDDWSLNRKLPFHKLGAGIKEYIMENGDPPDELVCRWRNLLSGGNGRRAFSERRPGVLASPCFAGAMKTKTVINIWVSNSGARKISMPPWATRWKNTNSRIFCPEPDRYCKL